MESIPSTLLAKIAEEAAKPTSAVLNKLLAPKLKRLEAWAEERDVKSRLESPALKRQFTRYVRRLLRRVSSITTIVFPQQALVLPHIYEPLELRRRHNDRSEKEWKLRVPGSRIFIIDGGGMGKSTFAKHLVLTEVAETDRLPILLELRRIPQDKTLLEAIADELDEFGKAFDRDVLYRLLSEAHLLIVLDGFDEVAEAARPARAQQIEELASKAENASLVVTSRPEAVLPDLADVQAYAFKPLSPAQAESLVKRYDRCGDLDVGARLIKEFDHVPERFLQTPLLISLLYRTYGFNNTISTRITSFYDEVYNALYKGHDLTKAGFSRPKKSGLDIEDFRRLLRGFAFLAISQEEASFPSESRAVARIEQAVQLTGIHPRTGTSFLQDLLLAVPLMVREGGEIRFMHKSIAEYFAAEYLAYVHTADQFLQTIREGPLYQRFFPSLDMLAELNPSLFNRAIVAPLAEEVIKWEARSKDPVIDTILFLDETAGIGLFRMDYLDENIFPPLFWGVNDIAIIDGVEYVLGYGGENMPAIPNSALRLVTKRVRPEIPLFHKDEMREFDQYILFDKWVSLADPIFSEEKSRMYLREICLRYGFTVFFGAFDGYLRILDIARAQELLDSISEENKTHEWVNRLLGSPPDKSD